MDLRLLSKAFMFSEALQKAERQLDALLKSLGVAANLIGSVAMAAYGYTRNTEDFDILINMDDYTKVANALVALGAKAEAHNSFRLPYGKIQLCYGGQSVRPKSNTTFPSPTASRPGLTVIELPRLLAMKASAGYERAKDRADFIELVKRGHITQDLIDNEVIPLLGKTVSRLAKQLWVQAQKEPP